ncbi:MAG: hypothetical protein ACI910_000586 [Oleispira sp.]
MLLRRWDLVFIGYPWHFNSCGLGCWLGKELILSGVSQTIFMTSQTRFGTSSLKAKGLKGLKGLKDVKVLKLSIHNYPFIIGPSNLEAQHVSS